MNISKTDYGHLLRCERDGKECIYQVRMALKAINDGIPESAKYNLEFVLNSLAPSFQYSAGPPLEDEEPTRVIEVNPIAPCVACGKLTVHQTDAGVFACVSCRPF